MTKGYQKVIGNPPSNRVSKFFVSELIVYKNQNAYKLNYQATFKLLL